MNRLGNRSTENVKNGKDGSKDRIISKRWCRNELHSMLRQESAAIIYISLSDIAASQQTRSS